MNTVCIIEDCSKRRKGKFRHCSMHRARIDRHGSPEIVLTEYQAAGVANARWMAPDQISYRGVHKRLTRERGAASSHQCVECPAAAQDWAYLHNDPHEMASSHGPYTADLSCYVPMCRCCHKRLDRREVKV